MSKNLSKNDIFGRLGGEEFAIILVYNTQDKVISKMEYIKKCVSNIIISPNIRFTVSIGLDKKTKKDISLDEILERADQFLYKAKDKGKNKLKFRLK